MHSLAKDAIHVSWDSGQPLSLFSYVFWTSDKYLGI